MHEHVYDLSFNVVVICFLLRDSVLEIRVNYYTSEYKGTKYKSNRDKFVATIRSRVLGEKIIQFSRVTFMLVTSTFESSPGVSK